MSPSPASRETRIRPAPVAAETTSGSQAGETSGGNSVDVMARAGESGGGRGGQVLAGLELHRDGGIGSNSSRANAAPYAAAARTPAVVTAGYSAVICSAVIPAARQSKITLTGTRIPAITAWPCITRGSAEINSSCSLVTAPSQALDQAAGFRIDARSHTESSACDAGCGKQASRSACHAYVGRPGWGCCERLGLRALGPRVYHEPWRGPL